MAAALRPNNMQDNGDSKVFEIDTNLGATYLLTRSLVYGQGYRTEGALANILDNGVFIHVDSASYSGGEWVCFRKGTALLGRYAVSGAKKVVCSEIYLYVRGWAIERGYGDESNALGE